MGARLRAVRAQRRGRPPRPPATAPSGWSSIRKGRPTGSSPRAVSRSTRDRQCGGTRRTPRPPRLDRAQCDGPAGRVGDPALSWSGGNDNVGVTGYEIYRDGSLLTRAGPESTYEDTSVAREARTPTRFAPSMPRGTSPSPASPQRDDRQSRGALLHGLRERGHVGVERLQGPGCAGRPRLHRLVGRAGNEQWYSDGTGHRQLGLPRRWIADRSVCPNSLQGPEPGRQPGQPARVQDRQRRGSCSRSTVRARASSPSATRSRRRAPRARRSSRLASGTRSKRTSTNGESGQSEIWLDGVRIDPLSTTASFGTSPIGRVLIGDTSTSRTYDIAFDEVAVDPGFIADMTDPLMSDRLSASATSGLEVQLSWDAASDDVGVTGYEVYRDGQLPTTTGAGSGYSDRTVDPGVSYYYEVRARDGAGNVSHFTDLATITTPRRSMTTSRPAICRSGRTRMACCRRKPSRTPATRERAPRARVRRPTPTTRCPRPELSSTTGSGSSRPMQGANGVNLLRLPSLRRRPDPQRQPLELRKLAYRNDVASSTRTSKTAITDQRWHDSGAPEHEPGADRGLPGGVVSTT